MSNLIKNISDLPSIEKVRKTAQGLALLDAVIMPQWEYRYFSFNCNWDGKGEEMMASMKNGEGAGYFIHFTCEGVVGKVLDENLLSNPQEHLDNMPEKFRAFKDEPAFSNNNASFFFWREANQGSWQASPDKLKRFPLLGFLQEGALAYKEFAENCYEKIIDINIIEKVLESLTVTTEQLVVINSEVGLDDLDDDFLEILGGTI
ncbi:hypothetical protein [Pseudomonas sp. R2-60-08W]|uniref:hypothetical protein n=1 Tax=Pseudomonas sp. R2-60-08W TaxID=1173280 RepID=UPI000F56219B|nr:hypothetical protein [Pseudomonas sp. R2-60-08W]AZF24378.1 hypothetical protein C4J90_0171 [Pseudomonas sp. R2-60-08W]